jgi:hypothetical protein
VVIVATSLLSNCEECGSKLHWRAIGKTTVCVPCKSVCLGCGKKIYRHTKYRLCHSCSEKRVWATGKRIIGPANVMNKSRAIYHAGIHKYLRSTWEYYYVDALYRHNCTFVYEPKRFVLSDGTTYLPDLWLPRSDVYVEIKGNVFDGSKKKRVAFRRQYGKRLLLIRWKSKEWIERLVGLA